MFKERLSVQTLINQRVACEILWKVGVNVETAESGKQALEALSRTSYDAVLMDIQMPEMCGYDATRAIRREPGLAGLPIIAMTAHAMKGDRELCLAAGMNDYVAKPIDQKELFSTLIKWLPVREKPEEEPVDAGIQAPPAASETFLPVAIAGIDVEEALCRLDGNERLLVDLLSSFSKTFRNAVPEIREALENRDVQSARRIAHTLKGVSGNISAKELRRAAERFEKALTTGEIVALEGLVDQIEAALNCVVKSARFLDETIDSCTSSEIAQLTPEAFASWDAAQSAKGDKGANGEGTERESLDPSKIAPVMNRLAGFLEESQPVGAEESLADLKVRLHNFSFPMGKDLGLLQECLDNFAFDEAKEILSRIAGALQIALDT